MTVKAVTFDFWSTLFGDTPEVGRERHSWRVEQMGAALAKAGWSGPQVDIYKAIDAASKRSTEVRLRGIVDFIPEEQLELILRELGFGSLNREIYEEVYSAYTGAAGRFPPAPLPGAVKTVREISKLYPVGLISNTGITPGSVMRRILDGAGMLDCFQTLTFSNEVNLVKPNPQIFLLTAENLGVQAQEILHIGDDFEADVIGAHRVGARGVWLSAKAEAVPAEAFAVVKELTELPELLRRKTG